MASFYDDEEDLIKDSGDEEDGVVSPPTLLGKIPSPVPDNSQSNGSSIADMLKHLTAANDTGPTGTSPDMSPNSNVSPATQVAQPQEPKKPSIWRQALGLPGDEPGKDEYGLQKPNIPHQGTLGAILSMAIPALIGATQKGPGRLSPLAAIGTSYLGRQQGLGEMAQQQQKDYQTNRTNAASNLYKNQMLAATGAKNVSDTEIKKGQLEQTKRANDIKENKPPQEDAMTKYARLSSTPEEQRTPQDKAFISEYEKEKKDPKEEVNYQRIYKRVADVNDAQGKLYKFHHAGVKMFDAVERLQKKFPTALPGKLIQMASDYQAKTGDQSIANDLADIQSFNAPFVIGMANDSGLKRVTNIEVEKFQNAAADAASSPLTVAEKKKNFLESLKPGWENSKVKMKAASFGAKDPEIQELSKQYEKSMDEFEKGQISTKSPQDQKLIQWARENPDSPDAQAVLKKQGLL